MLLEDFFPYDSFREGQKDLAEAVYLACKNGDRFVAEAMSGFGKTAAVLAGALLAAVEDNLNVIYVCRTKRQVFRVMEELLRFQKKLPIRATSLFSKYDYCLQKETGFKVLPAAFKWYCNFQTSNNLCSYFLNVPYSQKGIERLISSNDSMLSISHLLQKSSELHVCPYEVMRLSMANSKVVITTYHYLFDSNSRSVLLSGAFDSPKRSIAIVDEAHNIREFIAGSSIATISLAEIQRCADECRSLHLDRANRATAEIALNLGQFLAENQSWRIDKRSFIHSISKSHEKQWLSDIAFELSAVAGPAWYSVATSGNIPIPILRFGGFISNLLSSLDSDDTALVRSEREELSLVNINPAKGFQNATAEVKSLVLLSATINPPDLFLKSIGLDSPSTIVYSATSNYRFKIKTLIDTGVSTRFKVRTTEMYTKLAERIAAICDATDGGIGIFMPSYVVLDSLFDIISTRPNREHNGRMILVERPNLTNQEAEQIMDAFKSKRGSILFAVQGGRFSEGEDFPGDNMVISVVVGLALPPPTPVMFAGYTNAAHIGRHESYLILSLLPAMRKAIQCAGRHIRDPGKVGMVIFLDARFAQHTSVSQLPSWLKNDLICDDLSPQLLTKTITDFFANVHH